MLGKCKWTDRARPSRRSLQGVDLSGMYGTISTDLDIKYLWLATSEQGLLRIQFLELDKYSETTPKNK